MTHQQLLPVVGVGRAVDQRRGRDRRRLDHLRRQEYRRGAQKLKLIFLRKKIVVRVIPGKEHALLVLL